MKCFRLGPNAQIRKTKLKAKITPKSQMYFAVFNFEGSGFLVVEFSWVDGLKFLGDIISQLNSVMAIHAFVSFLGWLA